jgi:hypothetical protein
MLSRRSELLKTIPFGRALALLEVGQTVRNGRLPAKYLETFGRRNDVAVDRVSSLSSGSIGSGSGGVSESKQPGSRAATHATQSA